MRHSEIKRIETYMMLTCSLILIHKMKGTIIIKIHLIIVKINIEKVSHPLPNKLEYERHYRNQHADRSNFWGDMGGEHNRKSEFEEETFDEFDNFFSFSKQRKAKRGSGGYDT